MENTLSTTVPTSQAATQPDPHAITPQIQPPAAKVLAPVGVGSALAQLRRNARQALSFRAVNAKGTPGYVQPCNATTSCRANCSTTAALVHCSI